MRAKSDTERSRTEDGRQLKLDLREVLAAHRTSDRAIADAIDVAPSLLSRRLDPEEKGAHLQLVDLVRMPLDVRVGILRKLASRDGFEVVATGQAMDATSGVKAASALLSAAATTATQTIDASADNTLDRREATKLRMAATDLRDRANGIINICDAAIRDGVVKMRQHVGEA